jgi:hypothetical protein
MKRMFATGKTDFVYLGPFASRGAKRNCATLGLQMSGLEIVRVASDQATT